MLKCIKVRYLIATVAFFGMFLANAIKSVVNVTLVAIADSQSKNQLQLLNETLRPPNSSYEYTYSNPTGQHHPWTPDNRNLVRSAFFVGYVFLQIPSGRMGEVIGVRFIFGPAILLSSLLSFVFPILAQLGPFSACALRFLQGLLLGVTDPCIHNLLSKWAPVNERSIMFSVIFSGTLFGFAVTELLSGYLSATDFLGGWPAIYYIIGVCGVFWSIIWFWYVRNDPEQHWSVQLPELNEINMSRSKSTSGKKYPLPIKSILTTPTVYSMTFSMVAATWASVVVLSQQPEYMSQIIGSDIESNGLQSSLPHFLYVIFSLSFSAMCDKMRTSNRFSITFLRKVFNSIGVYGPAICLLLLPWAGTDKIAVDVLFILVMGFLSAGLSGAGINNLDISPTFAGTIGGITSCICNFTGFLVPIVTSKIVPNINNINQWNRLFYLSGGLGFFGGSAFLLFSTSELQPWDPEYHKELQS